MKTVKLTTFFAQLSIYYDSMNMLHIYAQHCLQCTLFAFGRQSSVGHMQIGTSGQRMTTHELNDELNMSLNINIH